MSRSKNLLFLIACLFCISNFNFVVLGIDNSELRPGEICELRENQIGTCQQIANCEYARNLLKQNRRSELFRCAFVGNLYHVCCPSEFQPKSKKFSDALCKNVIHPTQFFTNIVGGEPAAVGEFPFQVALGYKNQDDEIEYNCGGSLIADDIVLTAAHCASRKEIKPVTVKLGRASLVPDEYDHADGEDIEIQNITLHPKYSRLSRHNDIAIIKLKEPTKFKWPTKTICLANDDSDLPYNLTITGFGRNDVDTRKTSKWLLKATVNLFKIEECKELVKIDNKTLLESQFCAIGYKGADACQGDSGGPVSFVKNNGHYLYGIVSYGIACGGSVPGIYTKVNQYFEWIDNEMFKFEQNFVFVDSDNSHLFEGELCELKENKTGICREARKCDYVVNLAKEKRYNEISRCAFIRKTPYACCPEDEIDIRIASYPKSAKFARNLAACKNTNNSPILNFNIVGGEKADFGEFPFQAALGYLQKDNTIEYLCGGSLIADDVVVTAAHCAKRANFTPITVKLGRVSLIPDEEDFGTGEDIEIQSIKLHPEYNSLTRQNDVAIIKLKHPTTFESPINITCLSTNDSSIPVNLTVSGFGIHDLDKYNTSTWLMKGTVQIYKFKECKKLLFDLGSKDLVETQVCASGKNGTDACHGDSGGPLSYTKHNLYFLYGIVSYGSSCGSAVPGIYTKVNQFLEWIDDVMYEFENN